jgi:lipocalin
VADSVQMINDMVALMDALPKTAAGDVRVENPTQLAVDFVGIVAPLYQADYDVVESQRDTAVPRWTSSARSAPPCSAPSTTATWLRRWRRCR